MGCKLPVQFFCGFWGFREDEKSFHRLIEAVNDSKIGFSAVPARLLSILPVMGPGARGIMSLHIKKVVFEKANYIPRADPGGLYRDACGLAADNDMSVFIYNKGLDIRFHAHSISQVFPVFLISYNSSF